jgi:formylglycine-generating enzyme required for sulfatase activity
MASVSKTGGGAYCIDVVETTKGQYNKFITANVPVPDQIAICKPPANPTFVPRGAWPPATSPPTTSGLAYNLSLPVHYVDWCDAFAYCKWANKQLCGEINGGTVAPASANDKTKSAWYNACSAQGDNAWPYGTVFDGAKCNTGGGDAGTIADPADVFGFGGANQDDGLYGVVVSDVAGNFTSVLHDSCQGGSVGVYQMSGNAAEWEDSCDDADAGATNCRLRGGSYRAQGNSDAVRCTATRVEARLPAVADPDPLKDVGFRCCLY